MAIIDVTKTEPFLEAACAIHSASYDSIHSQQLSLAKQILESSPEIADARYFLCRRDGTVGNRAAAIGRQFSVSSHGRRAEAMGADFVFGVFAIPAGSRGPIPSRSDSSMRSSVDRRGADPNAFFMLGEERETALYAACGVANDAVLARLLLEAGADVNDEDASYHVAEFDQHECIRVLFEFGMDTRRKATVLLRKLDFDDEAGVRVIMESGADPNEMGIWNKSALHQAIMRGRSLRIIRMLLDHGADANQVRGDGKSPYVIAARMGRVDVMNVLLEHGANSENHSVADQAVIHCALQDRPALDRLLEEHGDLNSQLSPDEQIAICDAARGGQTAVLEMMLDAGFNISAQDEQGFTPLHWAAWYGHTDSVHLLLKRNAPLEIENRYGGTVIDSTVWGWANSDGNSANAETILRQLHNAGADLEAIAPFPSGNQQVDGILTEMGKNNPS